MLKMFIHYALFGPNGMSTVGIPIVDGSATLVVFVKLGALLSDGDGLKLALDWKGGSGLKCCFRHWNCYAKDSDIAERDDAGELVEISCHDPGRFILWDEEDLENTIDMLVEAKGRRDRRTLTRDKLGSLEKAFGFSANPHGILADAELRSRGVHIWSLCMYDWMHTAFQNGVVTEEVFLYTKACKHVGFDHNQLENFFREPWVFPFSRRSKGKSLYHVLDDFRSRASDKADRLKASASEVLGLHSLLRHWAAMHVGDRADLAPERASFEAACAVVDTIILCKRGLLSTRDGSRLLRTLVSNHLELHKAAYGTQHIIPKSHWLFDVAEQLSRFEFALDAFIVERLHLRVKRQCEPVHELN